MYQNSSNLSSFGTLILERVSEHGSNRKTGVSIITIRGTVLITISVTFVVSTWSNNQLLPCDFHDLFTHLTQRVDVANPIDLRE